jgi:hypothetical protein
MLNNNLNEILRVKIFFFIKNDIKMVAFNAEAVSTYTCWDPTLNSYAGASSTPSPASWNSDCIVIRKKIKIKLLLRYSLVMSNFFHKSY